MNLFSEIKSLKYKNSRLKFYLKNIFRFLVPPFFYRHKLKKILSAYSSLPAAEQRQINERVNYYNRLKSTAPITEDSTRLGDLKPGRKQKTYFFDAYEYLRYFNDNLRVKLLFGDITEIPEKPSILKSRPVNGDNSNSVLLKLNKVRHFNFINDRKPYQKKKDMLVFRGGAYPSQTQRVKFFEMYHDHPLCDIGQVHKGPEPEIYKRGMLTIDQQLDYKFILCLEGNDVSTNLKWVMSSNSLPVMPEPTCETWFMEGALKPDFHYIKIKKDFSDFEDRIRFYIDHPKEAEKILKNAHAYVEKFRSALKEEMISVLVLKKYFEKTGQNNIFR